LCYAQIVAEPTITFIKQKHGKVAVIKHFGNGQISQTGWLKHNRPHGAWASFDEKGHIIAQAQYERGVKIGIWRFWDTTGNLFCEILYSNGTLISAKQYDNVGSVVATR
jgi:antitoxin component YwqK of YwqJK toxin-antitoxin module